MAASFSASIAPASSDSIYLTTTQIANLGGIAVAGAWAAAQGYSKIETPSGSVYTISSFSGNSDFEAAKARFQTGSPLPTTPYDYTSTAVVGAQASPLDLLKKKYGPLPLWAWIAIGAGGLFLFYLVAKPSKKTSPPIGGGRFQPKAA